MSEMSKIVRQGLQYTEQKKYYKVIFFLMKLKRDAKCGICIPKTNFTLLQQNISGRKEEKPQTRHELGI